MLFLLQAQFPDSPALATRGTKSDDEHIISETPLKGAQRDKHGVGIISADR
jgi:hypothetical protein